METQSVFFVLDGIDACLVIDSGFFPMDVKALVLDLLRKKGRDKTSSDADKPVFLANTHGDKDHTGGNASFEAFYMTQTDYDNCGLKEKCPDSRLIPVEDGMFIELGGRTICRKNSGSIFTDKCGVRNDSILQSWPHKKALKKGTHSERFFGGALLRISTSGAEYDDRLVSGIFLCSRGQIVF